MIAYDKRESRLNILMKTLRGANMNRLVNIFKHILLTLPLACSFVLTACTLPDNNRQSKLENVVWRSEENTYGIGIELLALPYSHCPYGYIEYDGDRKEVFMDWSNNRFDMNLVDYYGKDLSHSGGEYNYIHGSYNIIEDDKVELVFSVSDDYLFAGELSGAKITVVAHRIEPADYGDVGLYHEVCWDSGDGAMALYTFQGMRHFSVGRYLDIDGASKDIVVYWLANERFIAYEIKERVQQDAELFAGEYGCDGATITLSFSTNAGIDGGSLMLVRRSYGNTVQPEELWYPESEVMYEKDTYN